MHLILWEPVKLFHLSISTSLPILGTVFVVLVVQAGVQKCLIVVSVSAPCFHREVRAGRVRAQNCALRWALKAELEAPPTGPRRTGGGKPAFRRTKPTPRFVSKPSSPGNPLLTCIVAKMSVAKAKCEAALVSTEEA